MSHFSVLSGWDATVTVPGHCAGCLICAERSPFALYDAIAKSTQK